MPRTNIPIPITFYQSPSAPFSSQRCINWIPVVAEGPALNTAMLMQPRGIKEFTNTLVSKGRGSENLNGVAFYINGNSLISTSSTGVITNHGFIPGVGRVSVAVSKRHLVIVIPGNSAYVFDNKTNTLSKITDPDFITSDTVVFKDTFFVFSATGGEVFFHSELNDPLDFGALDFGASEISPDPIVALHVNHNELFVLNRDTIELFQNIGGSGFIFQRIQGANIQKGCHAKHSLLQFDNSFCFVGGDKNELSSIWKVVGSASAQKISTDAVDDSIQEFTREEIEKSFSMTYTERGQTLALFTFESVRIPSKTFVYNATASALSGMKVWFEFQSGFEDNKFQVATIMSIYGKLLVSDLNTGLIGELDKKTLSYYGTNIFRHAVTQPFSQDGTPLFVGEVEATFESGVGLTTGNGSVPTVRMSISDNGGRSFFGNFKRKIGRIGEYNHRTIWRQQGRIPVSRMMSFTVTDPVDANFMKLASNAEVGSK